MSSSESVVDATGAGQVKPQTFAGGGSDPNAKIPIVDFIGYVETVEKSYPKDKPTDVLTRIRQHYYGDLRFQQLIPDAPGIVPAVKDPSAGWESRLMDPKVVGPAVYSHLTAKADEIGVQDNPSPYIIDSNNDEIDAGHVLLGLDALIHRRTARPYTSFAIPNIDPASWVGDVAPPVAWTSIHKKTGKPAKDAPRKPATADFDQYYAWSAPRPDLLGDADAFGMYELWVLKPNQFLSQVLRAYYLGPPAMVARRWRNFCTFHDPEDHLPMFPYILQNGGRDILFVSAKISRWSRRIDRLADLLVVGNLDLPDKLWQGIVPPAPAPPPPGPPNFTESFLALDKFADWLQKQLEAELRAP